MEVGRRSFLCGTAGLAMLGTCRGTGRAAPGTAVGLAERVTRDAHLVWRTLPLDWRSAPCLGNSTVRVQVHRVVGRPALAFAFGDAATSWETPFATMELVLAGTPSAVHWELDLWDAELRGTVTTTRGSVDLSAVVPHDRDVLVVSLRPGAGERAAAWAPTPGLAWRERSVGTLRTLVASADPDEVTTTLGDDHLITRHREWWNAFHTRDVVSVADKTLQRFHRIQLYHEAAVPTAPRRYAADHLALALPGVGSKAGRSANPVMAWDLPGLLATALRDDDQELLRDTVYPLLSDAVGFYSGFLVPGGDGKLHLPLTHSPEYADVADCTYDLSLIRWAAGTLSGLAKRFRIEGQQPATWRDIATRLTPYATDQSGVMIGPGVRLAESHPHASHLLWLYPLREKVSSPALRRQSFDHWASMRSAWDGTSSVTAAAMSATLDSGDESHAHLRELLDNSLTPNTLYRQETDDPVPSAAGRAVLEMMSRTDDGSLSLFPAVPTGWPDVSIAGLRAPGAFTVDASRRGCRTRWIRVRGAAGRQLTLRHGIDDAVVVHNGAGERLSFHHSGQSTVAVRLDRTGTAVVAARGAEPDAGDVPADGTARRWGVPEDTLG